MAFLMSGRHVVIQLGAYVGCHQSNALEGTAKIVAYLRELA
jgi:hypothetical protein